jgi:hypothetical protein
MSCDEPVASLHFAGFGNILRVPFDINVFNMYPALRRSSGSWSFALERATKDGGGVRVFNLVCRGPKSAQLLMNLNTEVVSYYLC